MGSPSPADRAAIADVLHRWCRSIDTRNWPGMRSILTDPIHIDYSSNGSISGDMPVEQWIDRLKGLHGFDKTLHMVSNLMIEVDGDGPDAGAVCTSYVNAMHFLQEGERHYGAHACGVYIHRLRRTGDGWIIHSATFQVAGRQGGHAEFDEAFKRARELAPSRMPA